MRTTLSLDDDVYAAAYARSRATRKSLGKIISEMARRGMSRARIKHDDEGFPVLVTPSGTPPIEERDVKELLDDEGIDEALRFT